MIGLVVVRVCLLVRTSFVQSKKYFLTRILGCVIIIIGAAIIASSSARQQFIAGRFILGMGISIAITGAPTYTVEVAPPQWR